MKKLKLKMKVLIVFIILGLIISTINLSGFSYATTDSTKILISDTEITINGDVISTNSAETVYKTTNIETNDDVKSSVENTVINITAAGTYTISGTATNTQIAVNAGESAEVNLILDNVNITCSTAPAIIIYSALDNEKAGEAGATITLADNSINTIKGSHIPKNATYTVNGEEKSYSAKYDGSISSDVSLLIDGSGSLNIDADKEGIETKMHLTINGGNLEIDSGDDAINASEDSVSVITINDGTTYANIKSDAEEGDGIDSNGYIYINGGKVYAFASATSQDSGLDSDLGIYINGGTVIGTGNMVDEVSSDSTQKYIFLQFSNQVQAGTLVCITDQSSNPITAYKTDKNYTTFLYSSSELNVDSYNVYTEGTIEGEETNGLYTKITSYTKGTEAAYTVADKNVGMQSMMQNGNMNEVSNSNTQYIGIGLLAIGLIAIIVLIILMMKKKNKTKR